MKQKKNKLIILFLILFPEASIQELYLKTFEDGEKRDYTSIVYNNKEYLNIDFFKEALFIHTKYRFNIDLSEDQLNESVKPLFLELYNFEHYSIDSSWLVRDITNFKKINITDLDESNISFLVEEVIKSYNVSNDFCIANLEIDGFLKNDKNQLRYSLFDSIWLKGIFPNNIIIDRLKNEYYLFARGDVPDIKEQLDDIYNWKTNLKINKLIKLSKMKNLEKEWKGKIYKWKRFKKEID